MMRCSILDMTIRAIPSFGACPKIQSFVSSESVRVKSDRACSENQRATQREPQGFDGTCPNCVIGIRLGYRCFGTCMSYRIPYAPMSPCFEVSMIVLVGAEYHRPRRPRSLCAHASPLCESEGVIARKIRKMPSTGASSTPSIRSASPLVKILLCSRSTSPDQSAGGRTNNQKL